MKILSIFQHDENYVTLETNGIGTNLPNIKVFSKQKKKRGTHVHFF
jgi:hypothetical protein